MNADVNRFCLILVLLAGGCATSRRTLPPVPERTVAATYRIGCPDVVEVSFASQPSQDGVATVDIDGRLTLPMLGKPRVEGLTAREAAASIAAVADLPPEDVAVRVLEPRAARVAVTGPDNLRTQTFPYSGPEPALDFLRR